MAKWLKKMSPNKNHRWRSGLFFLLPIGFFGYVFFDPQPNDVLCFNSFEDMWAFLGGLKADEKDTETTRKAGYQRSNPNKSNTTT